MPGHVRRTHDFVRDIPSHLLCFPELLDDLCSHLVVFQEVIGDGVADPGGPLRRTQLQQLVPCLLEKRNETPVCSAGLDIRAVKVENAAFSSSIVSLSNLGSYSWQDSKEENSDDSGSYWGNKKQLTRSPLPLIHIFNPLTQTFIFHFILVTK